VPLAIAGVCLIVACVMLTALGPDTSFAALIAAYVIFGIGFGFVNPPVTNAAVSGMPRAQAGVAAATATTSRQVGLTLGVAIVGAIVTSHMAGAGAISSASHPAWWTLAAFGVVVLALGFAATSRHATASAQRTAAELNPEALVA
jgi:MFS family permease